MYTLIAKKLSIHTFYFDVEIEFYLLSNRQFCLNVRTLCHLSVRWHGKCVQGRVCVGVSDLLENQPLQTTNISLKKQALMTIPHPKFTPTLPLNSTL